MMMDTRIPLLGQTPDVVGNLSRGQSAAAIFNKQKAEQTERLFLRDYGEALSTGDPGALQAYANINLEGAMGLKNHFEAKKRAAAARGAAAASAQAADEKRRIKAGMDALTVEQARINAMDVSDEEKNEAFLSAQAAVLRDDTRAKMSEQGIELTRDNMDTYFTRISGDMGFDWKPNKAPDPVSELDLATIAKTEAETAKIRTEMEGGGFNKDRYKVVAGVGLVDLQAEGGPAVSIADDDKWKMVPQSEVDALELGEGVWQRGPNDELRDVLKGSGTTINLGAGEKAFSKKAGELLAGRFNSMSEDATQATSDIVAIDRLGELLEETPTGIGAAIIATAADWGIKLDGASDVEAVTALINKLTPQQRQGMPGAASDRDVAMFRGSLPKLINTTAGNKIIMDTLRSLSGYKVRAGEIADRALVEIITPKEAFEELKAIPSAIDVDAVRKALDSDATDDVTAIPTAAASHPSILAAAKGAGVTVQDIWDALSPAARNKFMESE